MGVAVIAGLTVATVLTLVVVPVMYHTLDEFVGVAVSRPDERRATKSAGANEPEPAGAMGRTIQPSSAATTHAFR